MTAYERKWRVKQAVVASMNENHTARDPDYRSAFESIRNAIADEFPDCHEADRASIYLDLCEMWFIRLISRKEEKRQ